MKPTRGGRSLCDSAALCLERLETRPGETSHDVWIGRSIAAEREMEEGGLPWRESSEARVGDSWPSFDAGSGRDRLMEHKSYGLYQNEGTGNFESGGS